MSATFGVNPQLVDVTDDTEWKSSSASIAAIDSSGRAMRLISVNTLITIRLEHQPVTAILKVNAPPMTAENFATTTQELLVTLSVTDNNFDWNHTIHVLSVNLTSTRSHTIPKIDRKESRARDATAWIGTGMRYTVFPSETNSTWVL